MWSSYVIVSADSAEVLTLRLLNSFERLHRFHEEQQSDAHASSYQASQTLEGKRVNRVRLVLRGKKRLPVAMQPAGSSSFLNLYEDAEESAPPEAFERPQQPTVQATL